MRGVHQPGDGLELASRAIRCVATESHFLGIILFGRRVWIRPSVVAGVKYRWAKKGRSMITLVTSLESRLGKFLADTLLLVAGLGAVAWAVHAFTVDFAVPVAAAIGTEISATARVTGPLVAIATVGISAAFAVAVIITLRSLAARWIRKEREIRDEALGLLDRVRHATEDIRIATQMGQSKLSNEAKRNEGILECKRQEILRLSGKLLSQAERLVPLFAAAESRLVERERSLNSAMHDATIANDVVSLDDSIPDRSHVSSPLQVPAAN